MTTDELHPSGDDDIIFYLRQEIQLLSLIMRDGLGLRMRLLTTRRTILRQHAVSLTCGQRENVLFIGKHTTSILLILCSMLW